MELNALAPALLRWLKAEPCGVVLLRWLKANNSLA